MKILFPIVDRESNKEVLASGFHETKDICIFNSDTQESKHMNIDDLGRSMRSLPKALNDYNIASIICTEIRPMALHIFERCGLKVFKAVGTDVADNLERFRMGLLNEYSVHLSRELLSTCGSSCSSCSSTTCS